MTSEAVEIISNPRAEPLEVWFEPWGMPHTLAPGRSFRVVAVSDQPGRLEVVQDEPGVTVYAWPGATVRVDCDGRPVDDFAIPCPPLPPGIST